MTSKPVPLVELNQVWQDNDPRAHGRQVRIVGVDATYATVELVVARQVSALSGRQTTAKPGRRTRIRYDRFRPTSTGYVLVRNSNGSVPVAPADAYEVTPETVWALVEIIDSGKPHFGPSAGGAVVDGLTLFVNGERRVARFGDWIVRGDDGQWSVGTDGSRA